MKQLQAYYDGKITLVEDGAAYHGSKVVKAFQSANSDRLTIERLPAFSPDYNPIEKLWKNTKKESTHLKYFKTFEDLYASVIKTFKNYMQDASKILCVMKLCVRILRSLDDFYWLEPEVIYLKDYRRISIQHRLIYRIAEKEKTVHVLRMWTHYEQSDVPKTPSFAYAQDSLFWPTKLE